MTFAVGHTALLERAGELRQLEAALDARGRLVLVAGEAGVGKTVLLRRFCERSETRASCGATATRCSRCRRSARWPTCGGRPAASSPTASAARRRMWSPRRCCASWRGATRRSSSSRTSTGPTRRRSTSCACSAAGSRPSRRSSSPATATTSSTARTRCGSTLGELSRHATTDRLRLAPLSAGRRRRARRAARRRRRRAATGARAGNPFFVTEALAAGGVELPATIRDAVLARVTPLSAPARRVLDAAAIVPGTVEPAAARGARRRRRRRT